MSMMVTGQTVANMLGVPAGTLLSEMLSWRLAFAILAAWALMTMMLVIAWVPFVAPIKDAGIKGQFRFTTPVRGLFSWRCSAVIPVFSAGGATFHRGCRRSVDGILRWFPC